MGKIEAIFGDSMPIGAFCAPQPETEYEGVKYPNKINEEQYQLLKDLGVNIVYGHAEQIGNAHEKEVFRALDICQKIGMKYLVRDSIAFEYTELGFQGERAYSSLSDELKKDLDERLIRSAERYIHHPACAGITFFDEPGTASFEGIAAARRAFSAHYPDKIFYVNLSPNNVSAAQLEFGAHYMHAATSTDPGLQVDRTNDKRYEYYLNKYFEAGVPDLISYDSYPFVTLGGVETVIHNTLWEIQQIVRTYADRYDVPYWNFMQVGGKFDGWYREIDYSEMLLQIHLSLAYGAKGLELFPCVFPNDYLQLGNIDCGTIDAFGNPTRYYYWLKVILQQVKACERYLMKAAFKGKMLKGEYAGLLPGREELDRIAWNEVIYDGRLPQYNGETCEKYGALEEVDDVAGVCRML